MADPTRPATNPIPDTDAPTRRPAERPSPTPQPQPAAPAPAETPAPAADGVGADDLQQDRSGRVQRSGGGADNRTETDAGQPSE